MTDGLGPTDDEYLAAAWRAAPAWGLEPQTITVLSKTENAVCDVELDRDRHVVMRLHRPGYNTVPELRSEVLLVQSMARAGLDVARPIPTLDGNFHASVPVGHQVRQVGLIEWVDGEPLGSPMGTADPDVVKKYEQIGEVAARIRQHSNSWTPPPGFVRRRWDAEGLLGDDPIWGRFWEVEALSEQQRSLFVAARHALIDVLSSLSTGRDRFGLVHADLHLGNLMADGDRLTVIDFDDAGFGWFAHELAVALHPLIDSPDLDRARQAIVSGYRRVHALDEDEIELIDTFLVIRCLMLVGWLDARSELAVHDYFDRFAKSAADVTTGYLADRDLADLSLGDRDRGDRRRDQRH